MILFNSRIYASGAYDNGSSNGKGIIGFDITWNPFNYFSKGQSYLVMSYGFTEKLDFHGYYSYSAKENDNYYLGMFYQYFNNKYLDIATAIGIRQYIPKSEKHIFVPQFLYTLHLFRGIRIGGSIIGIRKIDKISNLLGKAFDIALIIPIIKNNPKEKGLKTIDFCLGAFKPALWVPKTDFHPVFSIDFKYKL